MTAASRIAIVSAASDYALANFTFEVGPAVLCDSAGEGVRVVITDGIRRKVLDETFYSVAEALEYFEPAPQQMALF